VSRDALDLAEVRRELSPAADGAVRWAVVESYIFSSQGDAACSTPPCAAEPMSQGEYTAHLAQLFGAGARLINVYAWRDGGFYRPANGVVAAIRIWNGGGE
jgi:hypothetical protein